MGVAPNKSLASAKNKKPAGKKNRNNEKNAAPGGYQAEKGSKAEIEDDELADISASLAKQICEETDMSDTRASGKKRKKKMPRWQKIVNSISLVMLIMIISVLFLCFTKPGNKLLLKMGVNVGGSLWTSMTNRFDKDPGMAEDTDYLDDEDLASDNPEADLSQVIWPDHPGDGRHEDGIYNILLLGEEAIGMGGSRGRTDVIIIATLNTKEKAVKLTSLMRDSLVQIPGYKENKLNSAYEKGGLDLLYQTIAMNFDIRLDGAVKVNFENFEKIIDKLGGLDLTLTSGEARYLRNTNYISNPANRNVVEGTQHMNGNQVLGYARIRKRATITGNNNDYGRTDRHRIILNAIFEKYKSKSKMELVSLMFELLPMITTDIDQKNFELMLNTFIDMGTMQVEQLRIPADKTFTDNIKVRGMDVLIPDYQKNIDILHTFIFGDSGTALNDTTSD